MTPKLLLADDSVTIQRVIELTFADEDVEVVAVGDGRQAIERVQSDRPDIVLADVGMPERDGYEVAAFIKADPELSHIPVLLLTGAFEPIDEVRARAVGCDGVLVKPFEPQMVISRVRDLLAGHRTTDLRPQQPAYDTPKPVVAPRGEPFESPRPQAESSPGTSLEDYFDRLDAALASKTVPPPPQYHELTPVPFPAAPRTSSSMPSAASARTPVEPFRPMAPPAPRPPAAQPPPSAVEATPELDLGSWDPSETAETIAPAAPRVAATAAAAIEPPAPVATAPPPPPVAPPAPMPEPPSLQDAFAALLSAEQSQPVAPPRIDPDSNELVDEIVRRVIAKMGSESMKSAVLDAAERLVKEEIARIKGQS